MAKGTPHTSKPSKSTEIEDEVQQVRGGKLHRSILASHGDNGHEEPRVQGAEIRIDRDAPIVTQVRAGRIEIADGIEGETVSRADHKLEQARGDTAPPEGALEVTASDPRLAPKTPQWNSTWVGNERSRRDQAPISCSYMCRSSWMAPGQS